MGMRPRAFGSRGTLPPPKPLASVIGGGAAPYKAGRRFEQSVRAQLRRRGYFVLRAYASKGKVDLLAVAKDRPVLFVQVKRTGMIGSAEWNELYVLALEHGAWPVVAMKLSERTNGYFKLVGPREPRKRGRPWYRFDPATCEPVPEQMAIA